MHTVENKPTFAVKVIANNIDWQSLPAKLANIATFFSSKCNLSFDIVRTSMNPVLNNSYEGLAPLYIIDRGWYDLNVALPHAGDADIVMFISGLKDHIGKVTFIGAMTFNNVGPWEVTVFAGGENDHTYMQGNDMGNAFELYACHELSHVFYAMLKLHDDTHVHFPVDQKPYEDYPTNVLADFDFSTRWARLEYLKAQLSRALVALGLLKKRLGGTTL